MTSPTETTAAWRLVGDTIASHRLVIVIFVALVAGLFAASQVIPMLFAPNVAGQAPADPAKAVSDAGPKPTPDPAPATTAGPTAATTTPTIPDLKGATMATAIASLRERGLTPVPAEATAQVAAARVKNTTPSANARASNKDSVVIWVEVPDGPEAAQVLGDLGARDVVAKVDGVWVEQAPWKASAPIMLEIKPAGSRVSMAGEIRRLQTLAAVGKMAWVLSRPLSDACPEASRLAGRKYDDLPLDTTFIVTLAPGDTPSLTLVGTTEWRVPCKEHPQGVERLTWRLGPPGS